MRGAPGLAEGSTGIEHLINWSDPHGQNYAQQCAQTGHAGQNKEREPEAIGAMARDVEVCCRGMLLFHLEVIEISRETVEQERAEWIPERDEVVDLPKVLQPE